MENQEEMKTKTEDVLNETLHPQDYRITGDDYFMLGIGSAIISGPCVSDGDEEIKKMVRDVIQTNRDKGDGTVRVYPPIGYKIPQEWWDDARKNLQ